MCTNVLRKIPTGCMTIDKMLDGGFPSESVSLIYGAAETGKTTLALQCAVSCANLGYKTMYVDCDNTFSAQRLFQIASKSQRVAELIILVRPTDFREQTMILDRLADLVDGKFALVVVDTITSLYRAKVAESPKKGFKLNRELNRQLASLAQDAKAKRIVLLIVSQVRAAFKKDYAGVEPVATRTLTFWSDTIISMKPTESSKIVQATLEKTRSKVQTKSCRLKLEESGLHECSDR